MNNYQKKKMSKPTSLFRAKRNSQVRLGLPSVLPNVSLFANKVRKYKVVYSNTPEIKDGTDFHSINVPKWIAPTSDVDRQYLVETAVQRERLFANMNFRRKDMRLLYFAQMLWAMRWVNYSSKKVLEKLGGSRRFDELKEKVNQWNIDNGYDNNEEGLNQMIIDEDISKSQVAFMERWRRHLPYYSNIGLKMDKSDVEMKIYRLVQQLYQHNDSRRFVRDVVYMFALQRDFRYDISEHQITKIVMANVPFDVPIDVQREDVSYVRTLIFTGFERVRLATSTAQRLSIQKSQWRYDHEEENWKVRNSKLTKSMLRYRISKIYNALDGQSYGGSMRGLPTELPSKSYVAPKSKPKEEMTPDGLTLPKELSDELKKDIMDRADHNHKQHFVDHRTNAGGVHGVGNIHKFKPNARVHKAIRELRKRNHDSGVVPKNMHRLTTDRKVFQNRKTVAGGSVMIDCSGSMGFSSSDVQEVVELLPASWIAGYTGYSRKRDGFDGDIRIIADNGRIDTEAISELAMHGNNSVDFEALKLLAEKPEPRLWVSDQQVIGVDDNGYPCTLATDKLKEIERFVLLNNIIPINDIDMVKEVAKQLSVKK